MHAMLCSLIALGLASGWEHCGHRFILHASPKEAKLWRRYGRMGLAMREARFNHLIHHKLVSSCTWTRKRLKASGWLSPGSILQLEQTGFGEFVNPTVGAFALFSAVPLAVTIPMYLFQAPRQLPIGLLIGLLPYIATSFVHPYLHADNTEASKSQATALRGALSRLLQPLRKYHALHHASPWKNFNLLLGADQLISSIALACNLLFQALANCSRCWASQTGLLRRCQDSKAPHVEDTPLLSNEQRADDPAPAPTLLTDH
jgi:hypothetical protein